MAQLNPEESFHVTSVTDDQLAFEVNTGVPNISNVTLVCGDYKPFQVHKYGL